MVARGETFTNEQFGKLIAQNTHIKDANAKWVKDSLIKTYRLLPDQGRKWSQQRVERFLFELAFVKPDKIDWTMK
ncbi:hypothetical protein ESZ50_03800 [Weissella muntiaci]|jgi:hypothetical protein|uniref:Uncharacterized protein n=1 Tax=Weissella muntiaci TaxID=2508881 RepID=A0A6C2C8F9_9LACO|nr:hypothetical protein [Weissella muntiaci]TYC50187.1 hypothetical protein ESZ50_03800 [Weissella muntiaci]